MSDYSNYPPSNWHSITSEQLATIAALRLDLTAQSAEIERLRAAWDELESRIQSTASTLRGAHVNSNDLLGRVLRDLRNLKSEALAPSGETK